MKKFITFLIIVQIGTNANYAQVGIGTDEPEAMLDVAGTLQVRDETTLQAPLKLEYIESEEITELTGNEIVLIADLTDEKIVKRVELETLSAGLSEYILDQPNASVFSAKVSSGVSLLTLTLSGGYRPISFPPSSHIVAGEEVSETSDFYTIPSDGVYRIDYNFRLGSGVSVSVLSDARIGIIKQPQGASTYTQIASKGFANLNAVLLKVTFSETSIGSMFELNMGDKIYFGLLTTGLDLSLLTSSQASVNVVKVAGLPD